MWAMLSEGLFYFGEGGVTVAKEIDLRDKPSTYIFRTELFCGATRIALVKETVNDINNILGEEK